MIVISAVEQVGDVQTTLAYVQVVSLFVSIVLPILVGLVTTRITSPGVKAVLLLLFTALNGFLGEFLANFENFNLTAALVTWLSSFMVAVAMHFGLWKPLGVDKKMESIGRTK